MDWINRNIKDTALLAVIVVLGLGAIAPEFIPENDVKSSPVVHQAAVSFFEPAPLEILTSAEGSEPVVLQSANTRRTALLLVDALIELESQGRPDMVGLHGERGLLQLKEGTWRDMSIREFGYAVSFDRAFEPELNRELGTAYLSWIHDFLLDHRDEWGADMRSLLLAAYNGGPGELERANFTIEQLPTNVQTYVSRASALHNAHLADELAMAKQTSRQL